MPRRQLRDVEIQAGRGEGPVASVPIGALERAGVGGVGHVPPTTPEIGKDRHARVPGCHILYELMVMHYGCDAVVKAVLRAFEGSQDVREGGNLVARKILHMPG